MTEDGRGTTCSTAARERQDPLIGTAPTERRLLLVEAESGWGSKGFPDLPLPEDVKAEVLATAEATDTKVMLIRRPGRQSSEVCLMRAWCVVDTRGPVGARTHWGTYAYPSELLEASDLLRALAAGDELAGSDEEDEPTGAPAPGTGDLPELILVCTHGRKDVCCAVRGRPVAAELATRWPERVWECSHTGGDRFAANVLLLPDGAVYGGLDAGGAAEALVVAHAEGRPDLGHLRGAVGRTRAEQAALRAVHEQLGPLRWGEVAPVDRQPLEPAPGEAAASRVGLRLVDGRRVEVDVHEHRRPPVPLTCGGADKVAQVPVAGVVSPTISG